MFRSLAGREPSAVGDEPSVVRDVPSGIRSEPAGFCDALAGAPSVLAGVSDAPPNCRPALAGARETSGEDVVADCAPADGAVRSTRTIARAVV